MELPALLFTYASFALLHAVTRDQPLGRRLAGRAACGRAVRFAQVGAFALLAAGWVLLRRGTGAAEATLVVLVHLSAVATLVVALSRVVPRIIWGLAIAAPVLALWLAAGSGHTP